MSPVIIDPAIEEIREIRKRISAEHEHDPAKLVAHLIAMQNSPEMKKRLLYEEAKSKFEKPAA